MADFTLSEAIVKIRTEGISKLQSDLKVVDKSLTKIGTGTAAKGLNADFRNTTRSVNQLGQSAGRVGNLLAVMPTRGTAALSTFTGSIGTATTAMGGLSLATVGATAGIAAVIGAGAGLVAAVKSAGALESRLAEVATISKDVANNIKGFSQEIGRLSIATRTDTGLLAEGLYQTISAGITDTGDALKFLEVSANAARAGLSSVGVSVSGLTSAVSAFGLEASDVGLVADKFFKTVEVGKLRFEDIASSIGSVAPLASQLGISLDELLASGSALTLTGQTLSESFTNVQGVMNAVLRPSAEAVDLAEQLGIEFSATALQAKGLTRFLKDLEVQAGGDVEVLGQLFGRIEGLRGVLALTGNQSEAFAKNLNAIENAAGSAQAAVEIQNQTFQAQVDLLKNQLAFALQTVGAELLPSVTEALENMNAALMDVDWDEFQSDAEAAAKGIVSAFKAVGVVLRDTGTLVKGIFDIVDFLLIPGGGVPESVSQGASNLGRALTIGATNQGTEFLTSAGLGAPSQGNRVPLVTPTGQTFVPGSAATPTTPQAIGRPAYTSTQDQRNLFGQFGQVTPDIISTPFARQPRSLRTARQGGFVAPTADPSIEAITRTPIPGVQGQLIDPSTAITFQDAAQTFSDALTPIAPLADLTARPDLGEGQRFVDDITEAQRQAALRPSVAVPGAFGTQQQDFGFMPGGQSITPLLEEEGKRLAENFSLVGAAIEGGQAGGLPGALIAVGAGILQMTEGFGRIQDAWNMLIGRLVGAIEPVIAVLADALTPIFDALGSVLIELTPIFELLANLLNITLVPAMKVLGRVINVLAKGIGLVTGGIIRVINFVIGLINRLPFVDIPRINTTQPQVVADQSTVAANARADQLGRVDRNRDSGRGGRQAASGGLRVASITGASRDIIVEALRPLRQLNTTFPAMLGVLEDIRDGLGGVARQPAFAMPNAPNLQAVLPRQDAIDGVDAGGQFGNRQGGIVIENLNINVDQVAEVGDIENLERRLAENLDLQQRNAGVVFPNNR